MNKEKRKISLWIWLIGGLLILSFVGQVTGMNDKTKTVKSAPEKTEVPVQVKKVSPVCERTAIVLSAEWWAKELGRPASSVLASYKINLWSKPSVRGKGHVTGKMMPGSHAKILDETEDDYLVKSPLDQSIGWVKKIQFEGTTYQWSDTNEPCTP